MKKLTTLIAGAGLTAILCANAEAGTPVGVPSETVRYADLDVAKARDIPVLYRRIDAAVARVCGERMQPGSLVVSAPWRRCTQGALHDAVSKINSPALAAYAASHGVLVRDAAVARRD